MGKHTPGPWWVRTRNDRSGEIADCFVTAKDVNGFAYDAEILGEDEYQGDIDRKIADCNLVAAAPEMLELLVEANQLFELIAHISPFDEPGDGSLGQRLRAAIAKAAGQPHD